MWRLNAKGRTLTRAWIEAMHIRPTRETIAKLWDQVEENIAENASFDITVTLQAKSAIGKMDVHLPLNLTLFDWIEDDTTTTP